MSSTGIKPPFTYYGGKSYMTDWLIENMPEHDCYVEVFGGSGAFLFAKYPSRVEVYNDIDKRVANFFRVLRDEEKREKLIEQLILTPYSRDEHTEAKTNPDEGDDIERARRFFVGIQQSFSGIFGNTFGISTTDRKALKWANKVDRLYEVIHRLRTVIIENMSFEEVIPKYDSKKTFFYLDPPYVMSSRTGGKGYVHEMTVNQHIRMINVVKSVKGKVMISGYHNQLYDEMLSDWYVEEKDFTVKASLVEERRSATEVLWMNYDPSEAVSNIGLGRWMK